jgi:paraquat-inducible protein B
MNLLNPKGKTIMKTSILVAAIVAGALAAPIVSAQDKSLSAPIATAHKKAAPVKPAMSMDMDKQMSQMQESMKTMQQQMEKLRATTDPQERQRLMQEHMQTMQESMQAMRGMGGPMMMGSGQSSGTAKGGHKHAARGDMTQRQEMMEKRMDMMQMMMEQMMQHDQATQSMPAK